jgi:hypothetical protein
MTFALSSGGRRLSSNAGGVESSGCVEGSTTSVSESVSASATTLDMANDAYLHDSITHVSSSTRLRSQAVVQLDSAPIESWSALRLPCPSHSALLIA